MGVDDDRVGYPAHDWIVGGKIVGSKESLVVEPKGERIPCD
jgi:hypothetical protein